MHLQTKKKNKKGPSEPIQLISIPERNKRQNWLKATLDDVEGQGATKGSFRERKRPKRYAGYGTYMTKLIEA